MLEGKMTLEFWMEDIILRQTCQIEGSLHVSVGMLLKKCQGPVNFFAHGFMLLSNCKVSKVGL